MRVKPCGTIALACAVLVLTGLLIVTGTQSLYAPPVPFTWNDTLGGAAFTNVNSMVYDPVHGVIYIATQGQGVWLCSDLGAVAPTYSDTGLTAGGGVVNSLAYDSAHDCLYAGTANGLWICSTPATAPSWAGSAGFAEINSLAYDGEHDCLYVGWYDGGSASYMGVWRCDNPRGPSPTMTNLSSYPGPNMVYSLVYDGTHNMLYSGGSHKAVLPASETGAGIWRCSNPDSSPTWTDTGTGTIDSYFVMAMAYDATRNLLYAGTFGYGVWRCSSPDASPGWVETGSGYDGIQVEALVYDPNNNALYAGGMDSSGVKQCLTPDATPAWSAAGGDIGSYDVNALVLDPYQLALYADCYDFNTFTKQDIYWAGVEPESLWYFAEGWTGDGFQEYLCLGNPNAAAATAEVTYLFPDGSAVAASYDIPASSRYTIDVNAAVGSGREVSLRVSSSSPQLIAERPMYFSYGSGWTGGHDTIGASFASNVWFFAEGYTGEGFEEWVCVLNPGDVTSELTFNFQTQEEGEIVKAGQAVPAHSRATFKINDLLGSGYQTSLVLESTLPVVAERPMYFDYQGTGGHAWTGGHCVMGAISLSHYYYFAEGTTRTGFEEWLTLQNPNPTAITVEATYQFGPGQGTPLARTYTIPANERFTVNVNGEVGPDRDVSVSLSSLDPFLSERPTYFNYSGTGSYSWTGGHCVIGAMYESPLAFFAEGYTGSGFEEWLCMLNNNSDPVDVTIQYYTQEAGLLADRTLTIQPRSRQTVFVNSPDNPGAGPNYQLSTMVTASDSIVVERPMYFRFNGAWTGGHDVVGVIP